MKPGIVLIVLGVVGAATFLTALTMQPMRQHVTVYDTVRVTVRADSAGHVLPPLPARSPSDWRDALCQADYRDAKTQEEQRKAADGWGPRMAIETGGCRFVTADSLAWRSR